ncbi:hypothetical protein ACOMHN_042123 [Nucella lapillus]
MADVCKLVEMAKSFLLQRTVVFCAIVIASLFVIAPMGILQTKFSSECLLYSDVVYEYFRANGGRPDMVLFRIRFGPQSVCQYTVAVTALFSFIYALIMFLIYLLSFRKEEANKVDYDCDEEVRGGHHFSIPLSNASSEVNFSPPTVARRRIADGRVLQFVKFE